MQDMGAPDKVYLCSSDRTNQEYEDAWFYNPWGEDCVEYTRTDVFIEKACDFIKANIDHHIGHYLNDDDTYLDDSFFEDFKKYMEG